MFVIKTRQTTKMWIFFRNLRRPFCFELSKRMSSQAPSKPPIHQALAPISWLIGKWRGEGCGTYPDIKPFEYHEEVNFDHFGKPILTYDAKSFSLDQTPMHYESGFLRMNPGTSKLAFMIAQNAGISEVEEGEVKGKEIHLISHNIGRMTFGKDPIVTKVERLYRLSTTDQDTMEFIMHMETDKTDHTKHLHITYKRVKEN